MRGRRGLEVRARQKHRKTPPPALAQCKTGPAKPSVLQARSIAPPRRTPIAATPAYLAVYFAETPNKAVSASKTKLTNVGSAPQGVKGDDALATKLAKYDPLFMLMAKGYPCFQTPPTGALSLVANTRWYFTLNDSLVASSVSERVNVAPVKLPLSSYS